jgi:hypothetical protein
MSLPFSSKSHLPVYVKPIHETINVPVILYGYETWSFKPRKEPRLSMFNFSHMDLILHLQGAGIIAPSITMFTSVFYIGEYAGGLSKLCQKYVTDIWKRLRKKLLRKMDNREEVKGWWRKLHEDLMCNTHRELRDAYKMLENLKGRDHLGNKGIVGRIILHEY